MPNGVVSVRYHVVSELLCGVSLSDLLQGVLTDQFGNDIPYARTLYQQYTTDPERFAVTVIKKVLSGILTLHDAGYIHRDIDPTNIMITREGKIKLIDFGIAKKVDGLKTHDRNLTTAGQFMGKPQYAAPELIIGDLKNQNKPTDIYALGVLLFQLITGHLPFEGPSNVVLNCHLHDKMPLKQIKDSGLRKIVERATMKDCTKRFQTAAEFRAALDSWQAHPSQGIDVKQYLPWIGGGLGALIVVVGIIIGISRCSSADKPVAPKPQVEVPTATNITAVKQMLLNPTQAKEGYRQLLALAKNGDIEAQYIESRLYVVTEDHYTVSEDILNMQANLKGVLQPNQQKSYEMLKAIADAHPDYYPALYDLACYYYDVTRELEKVKPLLDSASIYTEKAGDPVYRNKIRSMLQNF